MCSASTAMVAPPRSRRSPRTAPVRRVDEHGGHQRRGRRTPGSRASAWAPTPCAGPWPRRRAPGSATSAGSARRTASRPGGRDRGVRRPTRRAPRGRRAAGRSGRGRGPAAGPCPVAAPPGLVGLHLQVHDGVRRAAPRARARTAARRRPAPPRRRRARSSRRSTTSSSRARNACSPSRSKNASIGSPSSASSSRSESSGSTPSSAATVRAPTGLARPHEADEDQRARAAYRLHPMRSS